MQTNINLLAVCPNTEFFTFAPEKQAEPKVASKTAFPLCSSFWVAVIVAYIRFFHSPPESTFTTVICDNIYKYSMKTFLEKKKKKSTEMFQVFSFMCFVF